MKTAFAKHCPSCGERYDADVLFCPRDGTPLVSSRSPSFAGIVAEKDPYIGVELAGQIQIKSLIGIGSMGRVYRAFQAGIDRAVAVKILHRELSGNAELVGRFHREARVASRLVHANVVQVLMTGNVPTQADPRIGGELYLVMEHLDGISLLSALAAAGGEGAALPLPRALHIALQICDAVGEAHAQGIVHRDLKPENVMLVKRGEDPDYVKVLDFGIARLTWIDRSMATQAGLIFGTAKYISPEGAEGHPVGPQADVYSIATMLYQCLAGRAPFEGDSHVTLLMHHAHTSPPPLTSVARASYVPAPIAGVIMQNLAKKPADRAPDARALGRDLINAARESGLFPEDIVTQSALLLSARPGSVKLASKERTKSLDLSQDLASKIGGVAARPSEAPAEAPVEAAKATKAEGDAAPTDSPNKASPSHRPPPAAQAGQSAQAAQGAQAAQAAQAAHTAQAGQSTQATHAAQEPIASPASEGPKTHPSAPTENERSSATPVSTFASEIEAEIAHNRDAIPIPQAPQPSTIQGTETSLIEGQPPPARPRSRGRSAMIAAIAACAAVAIGIVVVRSERLGSQSALLGGSSIESEIDDARDCIRRHAWDAPADPNVKVITDRALSRWPSDPRVREVRREAAERIVADALGRKYAGDIDGALHLARLALELSPTLTTAQHLAAELEASRKKGALPTSPEVAPERAPQPIERAPQPDDPQPSQAPSSKGSTGATGATAPNSAVGSSATSAQSAQSARRPNDSGSKAAPGPSPRIEPSNKTPTEPSPSPPPAPSTTQAPPVSTGPWL